MSDFVGTGIILFCHPEVGVHLARGQRDEIKLLLEMEPSRRRVIYQIITNIEHAQLEEMGFRVSGPEGKIYHRFKNDDDFSCAVDNCLASIIEARRITSE